MRMFLGWLMLCVAQLTAAQTDIKIIDETNNFARPVLIVKPKFPRVLGDSSLPVKLHLKGKVAGNGVFELAAVEPATGAEAAEAAIVEVLDKWRFRPAVGKDCIPRASEAIVDVWFELVDGDRVVSVSSPKLTPRATPATTVLPKRRTFVDAPQPVVYPNEARRFGADGFADLLFQVAPDGKVLASNVIQSNPLDSFGEAALLATRFISFSKREDGDENICISIPFLFCMDSGVRVPLPACEKKRK